MTIILRTLACAVVTMAATGADAHHSGAMFDQEKSVELAGEVVELQWSNPHCWIQVQVDADRQDPKPE